MKVLKYPVLPVTLFLALGILADYQFKPALLFVIGITCFAVAAFTVLFLRVQKSLIQERYFFLATCLLSFTTGILTHWLHYAPNHSSHYTHFLGYVQDPLVEGVVSEKLKPNEYYNKYYLSVTSINKVPASGTILLTTPKDKIKTLLHPGDILIIADSPQAIAKPLNPYQFDYASYMANQNVFHQLQLKENYIYAGQQKNADYFLENLRTVLINSFDRHSFSPGVKSIVNALLFGQRQDMDKDTVTSYTNAGVVHILAISGLHFSILFLILSYILKPLNRFRGGGKLGGLVLTLAFLWVFAIVSGLSASVVRSVVMFSFVGIGVFLNRNTSIYNSILVSILVLLLAKPNFLFDVGFQLSYLAVLAIILLQPLYNKIRRSKYKAVNYLTDTVAISLVAQIGVLPLSLYYFHQFPLLFLVANIIVIPLSTAVLIAGLIVLILNFTVPALSIWVAQLLEFLIIIMNSFIRWTASFENLVLKDIPFSLALTISMYFTIAAGAAWLYKKSYKRTVALLLSVIVFQLTFTTTALKANNGDELIVFHNRKSTLLTIKAGNTVSVFSTDSMAKNLPAFRNYCQEIFNTRVESMPLQNTLWYKKNKLLVLDSLAIYNTRLKPDILVLTHSPKVNPDRVLEQLKPAQVVADATNYKDYVAHWKATCAKRNIPFHATQEDGYYRLK